MEHGVPLETEMKKVAETYTLVQPVYGLKARTLTHIKDADGRMLASVPHHIAPALIAKLNEP